MVDFLDLNLVKDPVYMNLVLGISFVLYSDTAFFTLQPMYLFELGFSKVIRAPYGCSFLRIYLTIHDKNRQM